MWRGDRRPDFEAFSKPQRASAARLTVIGVIAAIGVSLTAVSLTSLPSIVIGATTGDETNSAKPLAPLDSFAAPSAGQKSADEKSTSAKARRLAALNEAPNLIALPIVEVTAVPAPEIKIVKVRKGDTLMKALTRAGAPRREAYEAISVLDEVFDPRRLRIGQEISLSLAVSPTGQAPTERLLSVHIATGVDREVNVRRGAGDGNRRFVSAEVVRELDKRFVRAKGVINNSLFLAARRGGVPIGVLMEMIRIFSWDVDFQRDIQRGDTFEVYFERFHDDEARPVKEGDVLYAAMTLSGTKIQFFRHQLADGSIDYFTEKGQSARKALLRTPVNGARLSSGYGKRRHPILGYSKMHRGLDFAAARGTPVMAGGDGVVEKAQRNGAYGRYIRIRHRSGFKTAYAHLQGYARGIKRGKRVKQGQIIGYIGSSGRSTGPHLHYEILKNGRQINPMRLKLPTGRKLTKKALARFDDMRDKLTLAMAAAPVVEKVANAD